MDDRLKDVINKVREAASAVGDLAGNTIRQAGERAGGTVEIAKLNIRIFDLESEIEIIQKEIGKIIYDTHRGGSVDTGALESKLAGIDAKKAELEECRENLAELKGCSVCPSCGAGCGRGDKFCRSCGKPLI